MFENRKSAGMSGSIVGLAACICLVLGGTHAAASNNTYSVKKGDSLASIAKAQLGSEQRWHEIAKLNHITKTHALRVGSTLRLPSETRMSSNRTPTRASVPDAAIAPTTYQEPPAPMKEDEGPIPSIHPTTYQPPPAPIKEVNAHPKRIAPTAYQRPHAPLENNYRPLNTIITAHTQTPPVSRAHRIGNNY